MFMMTSFNETPKAQIGLCTKPYIIPLISRTFEKEW
jgi:hypothetical protein